MAKTDASMNDTYVFDDSDDEARETMDEIEAFERRMRGEAVPKQKPALPKVLQLARQHLGSVRSAANTCHCRRPLRNQLDLL